MEVWGQRAAVKAWICWIKFLPASGELRGRKNVLVLPAKSGKPLVDLVSLMEESLAMILSQVKAQEGRVAQSEFVPFAMATGGASTSERDDAKLGVRGIVAEYNSSSSKGPAGCFFTTPE